MSAVLNALPFLERLDPRIAAEVVWRAWRTPRKPRATAERAEWVMALADESLEHISEHRIATYRWGSGPRIVLLVHGWDGRASDFAAIVRELRSSDRTILALDAPGHGKSSGKRTTVIDYGSVLAELAARRGPFEAVVSHSLGTPAVAAAAAGGLAAGRYVSISGVANLEALVPRFCELLGVGSATSTRTRSRIEDRVFDGDRDVWARYSADRNHVPESAPLLVIHDRGDRMIPFADSASLAEAHGPLTRMIATEGFGHSRILGADSVLDEVADFLDVRAAVPTVQPALA